MCKILHCLKAALQDKTSHTNQKVSIQIASGPSLLLDVDGDDQKAVSVTLRCGSEMSTSHLKSLVIQCFMSWTLRSFWDFVRYRWNESSALWEIIPCFLIMLPRGTLPEDVAHGIYIGTLFCLNTTLIDGQKENDCNLWWREWDIMSQRFAICCCTRGTPLRAQTLNEWAQHLLLCMYQVETGILGQGDLIQKNSTEVKQMTWSCMAKYEIFKSWSFWSKWIFLNNWPMESYDSIFVCILELGQ